MSGLNADYNADGIYFSSVSPGNKGLSGKTVADVAALIDGWMEVANYYPNMGNVVLINLGTNDYHAGYLPDSAQWVADYSYIINSIKTKFPNAEFFVSKLWRVGEDTYTTQTMANRVDAVIALHPDYIYAGDDERIWLENGDNGATMTSDGTHYSVAGNAAKLTQIRTILGF